MSSRVRWAGLNELVAALAKAPADVRAQGMTIIREATESTASEVRAAYPSATGTLKARVQATYPSSDLLVGVVQSTAPHSHMFEFGTGQRSDNGKNRGVMPAAGILVPIAQRRRSEMFERLKDMLTGLGFRLG